MLFNINADVELSVCSDVGGLGCPNYINVRRIILPIFSVLNNPSNFDSASDAATCLSMIHNICFLTLIFIGYFYLGKQPEK